jgi:hypothetical protein
VTRGYRNHLDWWPRPPELEGAPELAVLAVAHATVEILLAALLAANPHLAADGPPLPYAELQAARRIIDTAARLRRDIDAYRAAIAAIVAPAPAGGDDIPF